MSNFRVGVLGAKGKVGSTIREAIEAADDLGLAAGLDSGDDLNEPVTASVQTIVGFTQPDSAMGSLESCIKNGINAAVDTTGFTRECPDQVQRWLDDVDGDASAPIAPNFAIFVVLIMKTAEFVALYSDSAEVIKIHHSFKEDAPPGTATHTAEATARVHKETGMGEQPNTTEQTPDGARGAEVEDIPVHAVRMIGSVVHETAIFGTEGQSLIIKQDSYSCISSVPGVLLGVRKIEDSPGLIVGLEPFLEL